MSEDDLCDIESDLGEAEMAERFGNDNDAIGRALNTAAIFKENQIWSILVSRGLSTLSKSEMCKRIRLDEFPLRNESYLVIDGERCAKFWQRQIGIEITYYCTIGNADALDVPL